MLERYQRAVAVLAAMTILTGGLGLATQAAAEQTASELESTWSEFRHFVRLGREDAARSFAQALVSSDSSDREIYALGETREADEVLRQAARLSQPLAELVGQLRQRIDNGFEEARRDPSEIARQIERLGGSMRAYTLGLSRLQLSGEYALPQLIQALRSPQTPEDLRLRIQTVLPRLGKDAVRGLSAALETNDPALQEILVRTLGDIGYPHAIPALRDLAARQGTTEGVRRAVRMAMIACGGQAYVDKAAAEAMFSYAAEYYNRSESLLPDARFQTANVWYWQEDSGLTYKAVPREIFMDVYAMRYALSALQHDPTFYTAVPLWIAANLNKEALLPDGEVDPTRGEHQPSAAFYALAASARFNQDVLAQALRDNNSAVAVGAIRALSQTAGSQSLVRPVAGGVQPLVNALTHGDRHVRFLAGETLALANPQEPFEGSSNVLWVLNEALRQTGRNTAMLVAAEGRQANVLKDAIRSAGWDIIEVNDIERAISQVRASGIVDVVVVTDTPGGAELLRLMRRDALLTGLPVLAVTSGAAFAGEANRDQRAMAIRGDAEGQAVADALAQAITLGIGAPMSSEASRQWSIRASNAIRELGHTRNPVFDISRATLPLAASLENDHADVRLAAVGALAVIRTAQAQQVIAAFANSADVEQGQRIAAYQALSESLRRFGNQLTDPLARGVLEVVTARGDQALREAAAQALGAMNLPSQRISSLFLDTAE